MGDLSAGVCQFQDVTDDPTLLSRGREGVGGCAFEMAAECRTFAHSVGGGSWLERKLVEGGWVKCVFLVMGY